MFEKQQRVGNPPGPAILDQRALQRERLSVGHASETPHIEGP